METAKRQKSRDYPAISLRKAVEYARRILDKDRWTEAPALAAVKNMGYAGLNGGSRPALSALRKFGLIEYIGSGDNLRVKLSELSKRLFLAIDDDAKAEALWEAMRCPDIHTELLEAFPNWELPSDNTLASRLELEFGMQHSAIKPFIADLREGLEFATSFRRVVRDTLQDASTTLQDQPGAVDNQGPDQITAPPGTMKLPMPGSSTYIVIPESPNPAEAKRILSWLKRVVTPAVEFAAQTEDDETE